MQDFYCGGAMVIAPYNKDAPTLRNKAGEPVEGELSDKITTHKDCPHKNVTLDIEHKVWVDIQQIKKQMGNTEFTVLLMGDISGAQYTVTGYYIPEQEVTSTLVDVTEKVPDEIGLEVIGHLHSHHSMGAFQSGTDVAHINYPIHIVIADKGFKAWARHKTPCGCLMEMEIPDKDIKLLYDVQDIDISKIKKRNYIETYNAKNWPGAGKRTKKIHTGNPCNPRQQNFIQNQPHQKHHSCKGASIMPDLDGEELTEVEKRFTDEELEEYIEDAKYYRQQALLRKKGTYLAAGME